MFTEFTQILMRPIGGGKVAFKKSKIKVDLSKVTAIAPAKYPSELLDKNKQPMELNGCYIHVPGMEILVEKLPEEVEKICLEDSK